MAITYPREMPDPHRLTQAEFQLDRMQVDHSTRGGVFDSADIGPALWRAEFATARLSKAQAGEWLSVLRSLRGSQKFIKLWDPLYPFPTAYPDGWGTLQKAGGGAFTGQAVLDAVGANNDTVTLSGLPDGFQLQPGDFLAFDYDGGRRALHEIMETAVANASGIGTWTVEPFVRPGWLAATPVDLEKPWCLMAVDSKSITAPARINRKPVSFSAFQTLERP